MDYNDELQTYDKVDSDKRDKLDNDRFKFVAEKIGSKRARELLDKEKDENMKQNEEEVEEEQTNEVDESSTNIEDFKDDSEEIMQKAEEIESRDEPRQYKSKKKKEYVEDNDDDEANQEEQQESEYDTNSNYVQDKPEDLIAPRSKKKLALLTQSILDLQNMVSVFKNRAYGFPLTVRNEVSRNLMKSAHKLQKLQNKYVKKYHKGKDFSEMPISDDHLLSYFATRLEDINV